MVQKTRTFLRVQYNLSTFSLCSKMESLTSGQAVSDEIWRVLVLLTELVKGKAKVQRQVDL